MVRLWKAINVGKSWSVLEVAPIPVDEVIIANKLTEEPAHLIAAAPYLLVALKAAQEHLEYCGYGDSWERECARESKLEQQIAGAIAKAEGRTE